ncbi:hypothetical protein [Spiroplasma culicicola]|uniref:Uncharacterized protein n=1 Tax=Spiroplasma culicicola AES-1 TaxID=1276246 RepID=W6AFW1_9MOLU|nr:hypothetical protein [Spiroplasma culicicola]AHI52599.1 hypothetical protein SCULI_v1c02580 [Spiroplasma culicicola AES-1]
MAFNFDQDTNWIFTFCKKCWDFKKFTFKKPINFESEDSSQGICTSCKKRQNISLVEARGYYDHLNDHNV